VVIVVTVVTVVITTRVTTAMPGRAPAPAPSKSAASTSAWRANKLKEDPDYFKKQEKARRDATRLQNEQAAAAAAPAAVAPAPPPAATAVAPKPWRPVWPPTALDEAAHYSSWSKLMLSERGERVRDLLLAAAHWSTDEDKAEYRREEPTDEVWHELYCVVLNDSLVDKSMTLIEVLQVIGIMVDEAGMTLDLRGLWRVIRDRTHMPRCIDRVCVRVVLGQARARWRGEALRGCESPDDRVHSRRRHACTAHRLHRVACDPRACASRTGSSCRYSGRRRDARRTCCSGGSGSSGGGSTSLITRGSGTSSNTGTDSRRSSGAARRSRRSSWS
jgi:hypothetical protein